MSLFKFECINLLKNKVNYFPCIILTLLLLIPLIVHRESNWNELNELRANQLANEQTIDAIKEDETAAETVADLKIANKNIEAVILALQSQDKDKIVESKYIFEKKNLDDMLAGKLVGIPIVEQKKVVAKLEYLHKNNDSLVSLEDSRVLPLANYYELIFSGMVPSIIFLAISAILAATITSYEKRKRSIELINVIPKSPVFKSVMRYSSYFLFSLMSILFPLAIISVIVSVKNGIGNFYYPIATIVNDDAAIIPIVTFFYQNIIIIILWLLLLTLISFFISLFTGNYLVNIGGVLLPLLLASYNSSPVESNGNEFIQYFPTSYVNFQQVILGGSGFVPLKSPDINFINGVGTLFIFNLILISLIFFVMSRKKYN
ncbi:ABC transporter permease [Enterococcus innesii]|uniref:ABC transporter permease n=1 Tax=Enterococcus innesii TaxID=2839759 RepID=UPI0020906347|nr:ABC transporter permease [Enterococcus innesii]MCO5496233.1 ABC transporter permease [Enterococcus innesii]